jgi:SCY1-like protein 1
MWSFFSRDSTKDFPYEIGENVAGKVPKFHQIVLERNFPIFLLFKKKKKSVVARDCPHIFWHCYLLGFEEKSIWSLKKGKRKGSDEAVSIFAFEIKNGSDSTFELAKSSLKRIKTLRHPSVLQFLDSYESDKVIYVATEYIEPLGFYLDKIPSENNKRDLYLAWGIFQITVSELLLLLPDSRHKRTLN